MKTIKHIILLLVATSTSCIQAQQSKVTFESVNIERVQDKAYISFSVNAPKEAVKSNYCLIVNPELTNLDGSNSRLLTPIYISGKKWMKQFNQQQRLSKKSNRQFLSNVVSTNQNILYRDTVAYENWMKSINLVLHMEKDGCCDVENIENLLAATVTLVEPQQPMVAQTNYLPSITTQSIPKYPFLREVGKEDSGMERNTSVRFRVVKTEIDTEYSNNAESLRQIDEAIAIINSDPRTRLEKITIAGFASPEGHRNQNIELSRGRAEALKNYINKQMNVPASQIEIFANGEDWVRLTELVQQSDMNHKEQVLDILKNTPEKDRNNRLRALNGGVPYQSLLNVFYPKLRDACYINVWYVENPDINADIINEAVSKIKVQQYNEALSLLSPIDKDARTWNAIGVCYMMQDNLKEASNWFEKAAKEGNNEAIENLKIISE